MADDPASVQLADQIAGLIRADRLKPGAVVASERDLRSNHEIGRSVLRQAARILEERGVAYMRRGNGGGLVVAPPNPEFASRALAIAIESRMQGPTALDLLLRVTDTHLFLSGAPRLDMAACHVVRRLAARLEALSADEFQRTGGHHQLIKALRGLFSEPAVVLAYETTSEYGADLLPYSVSVSREGRRGELWDLTLQMVEALVAADIAALFDLRRRQQEIIENGWRAWSAIDREQRVVPAIDEGAAASGLTAESRAERLAREILRDVRLMGWKTGERIGGAAELMKRYRASVGTVRQAVRMLEEHSAVRMERGRSGGLFIAEPSPAAAVDRAVAYLAQAEVKLDDVRFFLRRLVLEVLTLLADRPQAQAELRAGVKEAQGCPGAAADQALCRTLARLSGNAALGMFADILATVLPVDGKSGDPEMLASVLRAIASSDAPKARRAFLNYAGTGAFLA